MIEDFIGVFSNAASKEYCNKVISRFDYLKETRGSGRGRIWTRQEEKTSAVEKENDTYFLGGDGCDDLPIKEEDISLMDQDTPLLKEFNQVIWNCYGKYREKYGIMDRLALHKVSPIVRVQKYKPSQGYHVWHCDAGNSNTSRRMLVASLYLNTVEDGGETEFLYQSRRVLPIEGTLILFPSVWTHAHRGNPPLKGNKYILTTWLEFQE